MSTNNMTTIPMDQCVHLEWPQGTECTLCGHVHNYVIPHSRVYLACECGLVLRIVAAHESTILDPDEGEDDVMSTFLTLLSNTQRMAMVAVNGPGSRKTARSDIATYAFALVTEVHELADELGWKPWKKEFTPNKTKVISEFADIIAFVGTLLNFVLETTGADTNEIMLAYRNKVRTNMERFNGQVEGYGIDNINPVK